MIRDAIKFLQDSYIDPNERIVEFTDVENNDRQFVIDNNGDHFEIYPLNREPEYTVKVNTLTSLVDYMKTNDRGYFRTYIHVEDERTVTVFSGLDDRGKRERLITASAIVPDFEYDYYHNSEELIIALQSKFTQTNDRDILLKVIGNIKEENVRNTGDTGFSQAVTVQTGITSVEDVKVPNPVTLAPYRTFLEVEQPTSEFVFRMKDGPRAALFEADGGVWRNTAKDNIKKYLEKAFADEIKNKNFTVIA